MMRVRTFQTEGSCWHNAIPSIIWSKCKDYISSCTLARSCCSLSFWRRLMTVQIALRHYSRHSLLAVLIDQSRVQVSCLWVSRVSRFRSVSRLTYDSSMDNRQTMVGFSLCTCCSRYRIYLMSGSQQRQSVKSDGLFTNTLVNILRHCYRYCGKCRSTRTKTGLTETKRSLILSMESLCLKMAVMPFQMAISYWIRRGYYGNCRQRASLKRAMLCCGSSQYSQQLSCSTSISIKQSHPLIYLAVEVCLRFKVAITSLMKSQATSMIFSASSTAKQRSWRGQRTEFSARMNMQMLRLHMQCSRQHGELTSRGSKCGRASLWQNRQLVITIQVFYSWGWALWQVSKAPTISILTPRYPDFSIYWKRCMKTPSRPLISSFLRMAKICCNYCRRIQFRSWVRLADSIPIQIIFQPPVPKRTFWGAIPGTVRTG